MNKDFDNSIKLFSADCQLAIKAVVAAGDVILNIYQNTIVAGKKGDGELVTVADILSNDMIRSILKSSRYPILSEEDSASFKLLSRKNIWIVDPLDGTIEFFKKNGEFVILIALVKKNIPTIGVMFQPTTKRLYVAEKGKGAYSLNLDGESQKISVLSTTSFADTRVLFSRNHLSNTERDLLKHVKLSEYKQKGSALKIMDISSGLSDLYYTCSNKLKVWDTAAANCVLAESGGFMTDLKGNNLSYNFPTICHQQGVLAVSNIKIQRLLVNGYSQVNTK